MPGRPVTPAARRRGVWQIVASLLVTVALAAMPATDALAQPLAVAAASDLQAVLPALATRFERETTIPIRLTFGSSGNFFSQIENGAPFDLFLSADIDYPRTLVEKGRAERGSLYTYALGQLVLWSRDRDVARGLPLLADATVSRVAIANPAHAPYGRAAMAALKSTGLLAAVQAKLVLGENVSQAAQFVQSGNAQAGLIPLALALSPALSRGRHAVVPPDLYPPIVQAAVIISRSANRAGAARFLEFLRRDAIVAELAKAGFLPPPAR